MLSKRQLEQLIATNSRNPSMILTGKADLELFEERSTRSLESLAHGRRGHVRARLGGSESEMLRYLASCGSRRSPFEVREFDGPLFASAGASTRWAAQRDARRGRPQQVFPELDSFGSVLYHVPADQRSLRRSHPFPLQANPSGPDAERSASTLRNLSRRPDGLIAGLHGDS